MRRFGWIFMVAVFGLFLILAYKIVDNPEDAQAASNMYEVPEAITRAAEKYGAEYHVSPELIEAMCWVESNYCQYDTSSSGCCGVMQVSPRWHYDRMQKFGVTDIYDIDGNIHCGVDYLVEILENDAEELAAALAIYNGQPKSKVDAALYDGYISTYAQAIFDLSYELETLHGKHSAAKFDPKTVDWEKAVG